MRVSAANGVVALLLAALCSTVLANGVKCPALKKNGYFDATLSLLYCQVYHVQDPILPISYIQGYENETLKVKAQFGINNLLFVDELESTIQIDFYFRLWWSDVRWNVPSLWKNLTSNVAREGIELYYLTQAEEPLTLWRPDLEFQDFLEINVGEEQSFKLREGGEFFWSRHVNIILKQPEMSLEDYPLDKQHIMMRFLSYGLSSNFMQVEFQDPPVTYVADELGEESFTQNPVWLHDVGDYSSQIFRADYTEDPAFPLIYETLEITLNLKRDGNGILVRFAMPILILLLLAGLTFWADLDSRIDTTMTILLSVSALYVVILSNIPLLGYLTSFDSWIFFMYLLLSICVLAHQLVVVCVRKADKWPMRGVYIRTVEVFGRCLIVPSIIGIYGYYFSGDDDTYTWLNMLLYSIVAVFFIITLRELRGLWKALKVAKAQIEVKIEDSIKDKTIVLSPIELFCYNLLVFRVFDLSTKAFVSRRKRKKRATQNEDGGEGNGIVMNHLHSNESTARFRKKSLSFYDSDDEVE